MLTHVVCIYVGKMDALKRVSMWLQSTTVILVIEDEVLVHFPFTLDVYDHYCAPPHFGITKKHDIKAAMHSC